MARASAVITKGKKVLLIHRKKEGREYWVFPGGLIEEGEKPEEAMVREIKEETGLDTVSCRFGFYYKDEESLKHPVFYCEVTDEEPKLGGPEAEKHSEENWFHPEWVNIKESLKLNIYPEEGRKVLRKLPNSISKR